MTISNPQLAPGVHFFERDEFQIQIGINPSSAIILDKQIGKQIFQLLSGNNSVAQICLELNQAGFTVSSGKNFLIQLANLGLLTSGPTTQTYDDKNPVSGLQRLNLNRETVGSHQAMKARIACEIAYYLGVIAGEFGLSEHHGARFAISSGRRSHSVGSIASRHWKSTRSHCAKFDGANDSRSIFT